MPSLFGGGRRRRQARRQSFFSAAAAESQQSSAPRRLGYYPRYASRVRVAAREAVRAVEAGRGMAGRAQRRRPARNAEGHSLRADPAAVADPGVRRTVVPRNHAGLVLPTGESRDELQFNTYIRLTYINDRY